MIKQAEDPGIGIKFSGDVSRVINKDGSFNVRRRGVKLKNLNIYYTLINLSWSKFLGLVLLTYLFINAVFALLYFIAGIENLRGAETGSDFVTLLNIFFFSVHTFTTVGYGNIYPYGILTNVIVSIESLVGILSLAIATGLLYGRFSRPSAKITFSKNAIIAPYRGIKAMMFRIANKRTNELMELEVKVLLTMMEKNNGQFTRKYFNIKLERNEVLFFPLTWTVVHPIDESSPLFGMDLEQLRESETELMILIKGFDDNFSQVVHSRYSYRFDEIIWDAKFRPAFTTNDEGSMVLELEKINEIEKL
jgi:inward rectifier potassium channel